MALHLAPRLSEGEECQKKLNKNVCNLTELIENDGFYICVVI